MLDWRFITAQAPWKGGVYERLIGLMEKVMKKSIGKGVLSDTEFENFVIRVESVLNTRPIVQLHDDSCDVLRPIDFLQPRLSMINENPHNLEIYKGSKKRDNTVSDMRKLFRRTEETLDKFWKLWNNQYLNCLRERIGKSHKQGKFSTKRIPKVGEIVLLKDEDTHRDLWRLAKITELPEGVENKIRTAKIRMGNQMILDRPISHLYPLEISGNEEEEKDEEVTEDMVSFAVEHFYEQNL